MYKDFFFDHGRLVADQLSGKRLPCRMCAEWAARDVDRRRASSGWCTPNRYEVSPDDQDECAQFVLAKSFLDYLVKKG